MIKTIPKFLIVLIIIISNSLAEEITTVEKKKTYDPLSERARAYSDTNKLKIAIENYGIFSGTSTPQGLWGDFQYISDLSLIVGIPGKDQNGTPYSWAIGKKLRYDINENHFIETGTDTTYWGATVSESWFDRTYNLMRTDWDAVENSKETLHNPDATAGFYYGSRGIYTSPEDSYPLIASSDIPDTWPDSVGIKKWPGRWAIDPDDPSGTTELKGIFVSDKDIYFEFDDRFATRDVDTTQGYPIGLKVQVSGYSFVDTLAEDIIFFDLKITNESEYNYEYVYAGFHFDANVYHRQANGSYLGRTNDDDMMAFNKDYDFAYIFDLDGDHNNYFVGDKKLAYSAVKFLDTPLSSDTLDLDMDGIADILPGDKLGLTSWHWFDWYFRPGARDVSLSGPWSGDGQTPVADNKEEIQYKILAGDNSNLTPYDSIHYFHPNINTGELNPRFDSVEGLMIQYPNGLDCVFIMASGPFTMSAGESIPLSFCLMMGEDEDELIRNAITAQSIFDNNYQIITSLESTTKSSILSEYYLAQNYPNPVNSETIISYTTQKPGHVNIDVFNILGQKIATLIDDYKVPGEHQLVFNSGDLSSGLYYYQIEVNGFKQVRKMLVLK